MSGNGIAELFAAYLNEMFLQVLKAAATLFWLLEKVAAGLQRFLTEENLWDLLLSGTLTTLKNTMPGILGTVVFGGSGGAGVLYLALMLAGLLLILPALGNTRFVEPGRVLVWSIVLASLFIGATWGYDLIGYLEQLRQGMAQAVVTGVGGENAELDALIRTPMYATTGETQSYAFTLPEQFENYYFAQPDYPQDYTEYTLVIGVWPVQHTWSVWSESTESQAERRENAQTGLAVALLTLIPATVLLLFGLIFAALTIAALVLMLFFIVALPLGFFEFGAHLLTHIVRQYVYLFAITLLAVTLIGILVAGNFLRVEDAAPSDMPNSLMAVIPILVIATLALSYVGSMAIATMKASLGTVSTSVRASMSSLNTGGAMPAGSGVLSDAAQAAMSVTGAAAMAGMTGGVGMALTAGAGAALGNMSSSAGNAASTLAQGVAPDNQYAQVFGSAARSRGGLSGVAVTGATTARVRRSHDQRRAQGELGIQRSVAHSTHAPTEPSDDTLNEYPWRGKDEGTFHVADSDLIQKGVQEFRAGNRVTARDTLARAFGSREVAGQVLGQLEADPLQRQLPIAELTQQIRRSAHQTVANGATLFDTQGNFTPAFHKTLWENVRHDPDFRHLRLQDPQQAQLLGTLIGTSVRPTAPLWQDPDATRKLAHTVLDPDTAQVQAGDHAALLSLQGLAHIEGWDANQLEALFEATRVGQSTAALGNGDAVKGVTTAMGQHKELQTLDTATAKEAARLALLVTRQGQSMGAFAKETPVPARPVPAAAPLDPAVLIPRTPAPTTGAEVPVSAKPTPSATGDLQARLQKGAGGNADKEGA